MIGHIIAWSLRNKLFVVLASVLLLAWGGWEAAKTPVDVFPDLTAPSVTVVTEAHGMAPTDVENLVTFPIETALNGAPDVRRVRSSTKIGLSVVTVEFEWGTNLFLARQVVAERLQLARATLPQDIPAPAIAPAASIMGEILFIALASDKHSPMALKNTAEQVLKRRILAVPGVAEVLPIGGDTQQFQVTLNPERLAAYGLTIDEVANALRDANQNTSAGFMVQGGQEYLIQGLGRIGALNDIADTVLTRRNAQPVLVRHVASVDIGPAPKRGTGAHNGKAAVVLGIQKQPGANTLELTDRLDTTLEDIQAGLPAGMKIERHIFRQADFIRVSVDNLLVALRDGAILVIAIVFAFLLSARATAISLVAIPLSLVAAILSMKALGATINTMTLGGMAIALGALVDDVTGCAHLHGGEAVLGARGSQSALEEELGDLLFSVVNVARLAGAALSSGEAASRLWRPTRLVIENRPLLDPDGGGEWAAGMPLVLEHWPTHLRGIASGLLQGGFSWGFMLSAFVFTFVYPALTPYGDLAWRAMFWMGLGPALLVLWIRRNVAESPVWLERQQHLHETQQQVVLRARAADRIGLGDDQVQHSDPLEAVAHVEDHADRAGLLALALDREQALRVGLPAHAHANRLAFGHDLRRAVAVDGRLDALAYPVLAAVEEQQRLELVVVLGRQGRYERDLSRNGCLSPQALPEAGSGHLTEASGRCRDSHNSEKFEESGTAVARQQRVRGACGHPGDAFLQVADPVGVFRVPAGRTRGNATCVSSATTDFVKD